ncbi:hypothetical protein QOT17_022197 [Balamuthia mandrillaris]
MANDQQNQMIQQLLLEEAYQLQNVGEDAVRAACGRSAEALMQCEYEGGSDGGDEHEQSNPCRKELEGFSMCLGSVYCPEEARAVQQCRATASGGRRGRGGGQSVQQTCKKELQSLDVCFRQKWGNKYGL